LLSFICLVLGLVLNQARAEMDSASYSNATKVEDVKPEASLKPVLFDVEMHSAQYLDRGQPYFRDGAANSDYSYMLRASGQTKSRLKANWDLETEYSSTEHWNYVRPREAYVSYGDVSLGRRKITYSNWEDNWNQGLFESRFMDDKLHNSKGGLIGLFVEHQHKYFKWRIGYLPMYLPDMGPHFWLGDQQQFASYNPWFHPPQSSVPYNGVTHNIRYSVLEPNDLEVIGKQGGMAQLEWKPSERTFARFSYAYKPMPQYLESFPVDGRFDLLTGDLNVELQPRFLYHHVANLDFNYMGQKNQIGLSVAGEHPVPDQALPGWEYQNVTDALIVSAYDQFQLDSRHSWSFTGSLFKVWGGDRPDAGPITTTQSLFDRRYQYVEAASLGLRKLWRKSRLEAGSKVIFDRLQNGLVYSGDLTAHLKKTFALSMAFDFFQVLPGQPEMTDGFIDVYRGNDRVSLGMSYVF
jgi:hypothetical protein